MPPENICGTARGREINGENYFKVFCTSSSVSEKVYTALEEATSQLEDNAQNPRDGNFENITPSFGELQNVVHKITNCRIEKEGKDDPSTKKLLLLLRYYIWLSQTQGRFLKQTHAYGKAGILFEKLERIYLSLLGNYECINPFGAEVENNIIISAIIKEDHNNAIRLYLNDPDKPKVPKALLHLGFADVLQSKIFEHNIVPDEWVTKKTGTQKELDDRLIKYLDAPLNRVKEELGKAGALVNGIGVEDADIKDVKSKIARAQQRVEIVRVNYLLEAAKRLKLKNHSLAIYVTDLAIAACEKALKSKSNLTNPEVITSAIMTLGWAYATCANLKEEKERLTGKVDAETSAGIYRLMLYGDDSMIPKETQKLLSHHKTQVSFVARSWQSIKNNGVALDAYGQSINNKNAFDFLKRLAINEVEVALSYANALKAARKYDDAINEYKDILKLKGQTGRTGPVRDLTYFRAEGSMLGALVARADKKYFDTEKTGEVVSELDTIYKQCGDLFKKVGEAHRSGYSSYLYESEEIKIKDTQAWAKATIGRIKRKEQGEGGVELKEALVIYNTIGSKLDDLSRNPDSPAGDKLVLVNVETTINQPQLAMRKGDLRKDLKQYDLAVAEYGKVKKEDVFFKVSRLNVAQAQIEKVRQDYGKSGTISKSVDLLLGLEKELNQLINTQIINTQGKKQDYFTPTEKNGALLMLSQIYGRLGWLKTRKMKRAEGNSYFQKARKQVLDLKNRLEKKDEIAVRVLDNLYQTPAGFQTTVADLLKAAGERNYDTLVEAERAYAKAEEISMKENTPRALRLRTYASMSQLEIKALKVKNLLWNSKYNEAQEILKGVLDNKKGYLSLIKLLGDDTVAGFGKSTLKKLMFKAYSAWAFCFGIRGGLEEKMEGEGAGEGEFNYAFKLYDEMEKLEKGGKLVFGDDFLEDNDLDRTSLVLTRADLLRAAGTKKMDNLISALKLYSQVITDARKGGKLSFYVKNNYFQAKIGQVEALVAMGKLLEETSGKKNIGLAEWVYIKAAQIGSGLLSELKAKGKVEDLSRGSIGLRALRGMAGALGSLGGLREELKEDDLCVAELLAEYKMALLLYHDLLNGGEEEEEWEDIKKIAKTASHNYPIDDALGFIAGNKGVLLDDEILYDTDTPLWSMPFAYIGLLGASRLYPRAARKYEEANADIAGRDSFSNEDRKFIAQINAAMGDLFCFKLRDYKRAESAYSAAETQIKIVKKDKKVKRAERSILFGRAKIAIEKRDFDAALGHYEKISELLGEWSPKWTLREKKDYIKRYLSIGDVWAYHKKDAAKAMESYEMVADHLKSESNFLPIKILYAQYFLGKGDVSRLRIKNYEEALRLYEDGVSIVKGLSYKDAKKVLAQLYTALADTLGKIGGRENLNKAKEYLNLAEETIKTGKSPDGQCGGFPNDPYDKDREEIEERVWETMAQVKKTYFEHPDWSANTGISYINESYDGRRGDGFEWGIGAKKCFGPRHCIEADYTLRELGQEIKFYYDSKQLFENGLSHTAKLGYQGVWEHPFGIDGTELRFNPRISIGQLGFTSSEEEKSQLMITPGLDMSASLQGDVSKKLMWQTTLSGGFDYMVRSGDNANLGDNGNLKSGNVQFSGSLFTPAIHLGRGLMLTGLRGTLGARYSHDEISATSYGEWQLDKSLPLDRASAVMGLSGDLNFGPKFDWALNASLHNETGYPYNYSQLDLGLANYDWGLKLGVRASYFKLFEGDQDSLKLLFNIQGSF